MRHIRLLRCCRDCELPAAVSLFCKDRNHDTRVGKKQSGKYNMWFWIIVGLIALVVAVFLALALLRGRDTGVAAAEYDLQVYRDQLKGVERDLDRGVVSKEEAARIKTEVSRRILDADKALQAAENVHRAPKGLTLAALGLSVAALAGAFGLYWLIGVPGFPDMPLKARIEAADKARETRMSQAKAEAAVTPQKVELDPRLADLIEKLRSEVAKRPGDLKGHELLTTYEARSGNYRAAYENQIKVIGIKGDSATGDDYSTLAELMIIAAGGYVSPEAEKALKRALTMEPRNGAARFYSGMMFAQNGRPDVAFDIWRALLEESNPDAPWVGPIRERIEELASWAGVNYRLPPLPSGPALAGPDKDAIAAAQDMSPEERQQMIRTMVERLSDRLANEGGSPQEWAQLIGALGVLGEKDRAAEIWAEARQTFAGDTAAIETIKGAAKQAGVLE